eukprot:scaffold143_cov110-Isochrysis_galbana.AAC.3
MAIQWRRGRREERLGLDGRLRAPPLPSYSASVGQLHMAVRAVEFNRRPCRRPVDVNVKGVPSAKHVRVGDLLHKRDGVMGL